MAQNIHSNSVVCWPTSLGWMMGPWLLYSAYLNKAPIALFQAHPPPSTFLSHQRSPLSLGLPNNARFLQIRGSGKGDDVGRDTVDGESVERQKDDTSRSRPSIRRPPLTEGLYRFQGCDWSRIECFSSTGEASSYEEYHWLMAQAGYKPIVEYCGGPPLPDRIPSRYLCLVRDRDGWRLHL